MRTRKHGKKNFSSRPIVTIYVDHVHENKETKEERSAAIYPIVYTFDV